MVKPGDQLISVFCDSTTFTLAMFARKGGKLEGRDKRSGREPVM